MFWDHSGARFRTLIIQVSIQSDVLQSKLITGRLILHELAQQNLNPNAEMVHVMMVVDNGSHNNLI